MTIPKITAAGARRATASEFAYAVRGFAAGISRKHHVRRGIQ